MAEVVGLVASIVTLLSLTKSVGKQLRVLQGLFTNSSLLLSLNDEIDGIATILEELKLLVATQAENESFLRAWQQSNFDSVIKRTRENLDFIESVVERVDLKKQDGAKNVLKRVLRLFDEKEISKHVKNVQRQKLSLLLGLSSFILRLDIQQHKYALTSHSLLNKSAMSMAELHISVHGVHDILRQVLESQTLLHKSQSSLYSTVVEHIGHHLRGQSSKSPQAENSTCGEEYSTSDDSEKLFKVFRAQNMAGTLEIAYGSATYFSPSRLCSPKGLGIRCNYTPPAWFIRMMISISLVIKILPRPGLYFDLHYVSEVPWEADILKFAQIGDLDALRGLLRSGRASATDRDLRGTTALHIAAYRRDVSMCRLLLSEGADSSAIMTYSNVQEMNITPLRYLSLCASFQTIPHQQQQEMIYLLGTATLPKIELTEKSPVQLLFATGDVECEAGPLVEADLKGLDLNLRDNCGVTFLMMACEFGRIEAVKALVSAGADVNVADKWGNTPLHHASWSGYEDCIEELLAAGADQRARNCASLGSQTPEDMALWRGNAASWNRAFENAKRQISKARQRDQQEGGVREDTAVETIQKPQIPVVQSGLHSSTASNYNIQAIYTLGESALYVALIVIAVSLSSAMLSQLGFQISSYHRQNQIYW